MQKKFKTACYLSIFSVFTLLAGCSSSPENQNTPAQITKSRSVPTIDLNESLQDPAKATCVFSGGVPALTYELQGGKTPVCQFANGKRCSEQAIMDGACIPG